MNVQHVQGNDKPITPKDEMAKLLKGKQSLTRKEIDDLTVQIAKDLGYL